MRTSLLTLMKNFPNFMTKFLIVLKIMFLLLRLAAGSFPYSTGHSQRNMLKTLTNSYEQIQSFANKNEVRVNEFIKIRKNKVTTSFLIHENEFVIPNSR